MKNSINTMNQMKNSINEKRKILHCRNRSKFQWKIVERGKIDTTKTQIQMYTSAHFPGLVEALQ